MMPELYDIPPYVRYAALWVEAAIVKAGYTEDQRNSVALTMTNSEAKKYFPVDNVERQDSPADTSKDEDSGIEHSAFSLIPAFNDVNAIADNKESDDRVSRNRPYILWKDITKRVLYAPEDINRNDEFIVYCEMHVDTAFEFSENLINLLSGTMSDLSKKTSGANVRTYTIYPTPVATGSWRLSVKINTRFNPKKDISRDKLKDALEGELRNLLPDFSNIQINVENDAAVFLQSEAVSVGDKIRTEARSTCRVTAFLVRDGENGPEYAALVPGHAMLEGNTKIIQKGIHHMDDDGHTNPIGIMEDEQADFFFNWRSGSINSVDCAYVRLESQDNNYKIEVKNNVDDFQVRRVSDLSPGDDFFIYRGFGNIEKCKVVSPVGRVSMKDNFGNEYFYLDAIVLEKWTQGRTRESDDQTLTLPGDSGSLLLKKDGSDFFLVGYVIGGGQSTSSKRKVQSFAIPIGRALDALGVRLVDQELTDDGEMTREQKNDREATSQPAALASVGEQVSIRDAAAGDFLSALMNKVTGIVKDNGGRVLNIFPEDDGQGRWRLHVDVATRLPPECSRSFTVDGIEVVVSEPPLPGKARRHLRVVGIDI